MSSKHRNTFQERILKGLIGSGSDSFGLPDEEEIISDYPLQRYFSAILFPEKNYSVSESDEDEIELIKETEEANYLTPESELIDNESDSSKSYVKENVIEIEQKSNTNHFYPNNIGLTFCIEPDVKEIDVEFCGGMYFIPEKQSDIKIRMPYEGFLALNDDKLGFPFKDLLIYNDGLLSLSRELKGDKGGKNKRSGEYLLFDEFKKSASYKESQGKYFIEYFQKLIGRIWKRAHFSYTTSIKIEELMQPIEIPILNKTNKELKLGYYVKTYNAKGNKYVKIQLVNISKKQSLKRFTPKTPELNSKSLFQAEIKVKSDKLLPYKSNQELNPFDPEAEEINFLFRKVKSFGIGHNCSVTWNKEGCELTTTFLPEFNIKDIKNDFTEEDFENPKDFEILNKSLSIRNLSLFSRLEKQEIILQLQSFVDLYGQWMNDQKEKNDTGTENEKVIGQRIIEKIEHNYSRLLTSITCLYDNNVFKAFQLANTAMLIQIIISNDKNFTKEEKETSQINSMIQYDDLNYFKEYDYSELGFEPKYRPFQLAFLLLSINGIIDPQSEDRKKIVDLIWFPTGGGKTEAYLSVTALTIIWRRMMNTQTVSEGVSVVMRYTLRLLTAQQFERASKLILSLEFLRKNYTEELKTEPISIGLWVGNQLTPGKISGAKEIVDEIERECRKRNGRPETKNTFQISSCPWCGTKLVSEGDYGFEASTRNFKIRCLNKRCSFHKHIPVQVVDEMLYAQPPTLLFATVDKFAQLAWKEEGHKFFNSLSADKLPPDLIIQDELHLLSGPLGSIVGLYESVVEKLCTKENLNFTPKIIASTATTRNTVQQIQQLYGSRTVNIFPPSGLTYNDSFFAKESNNKSRRKYIGFMPVGKTAIDTQLQLIAHMLEARIENKEPINDNYWTIVSYYNSLKDVGKIRNKVGDEILVNTATLQSRLFGRNNPWIYNHYGMEDRSEELTARVESSKIKTILKHLENSVDLLDRVSDKGLSYKIVKSNVIDLVLATNMFSVGIDISRLNLMLVNSMPKNIAEYIQASSRVGRKVEGLVVTFYNPNQARDKSYFEHFIPFHQAFYKNIEPLSVTPFTENTIDKLLTTLMITYVRHKNPFLNQNNEAKNFQKEHLDDLKQHIKSRYQNNIGEYNFFEQKIDALAADWEARIQNIGLEKYEELLKRPTQSGVSDTDEWIVMQSMREVDDDTFIQIKETFAFNPQ